MNHEKYVMYKQGVQVSFRGQKGRVQKRRLRVFDFENPENNHFMIVRELWVQGRIYRRRPDLVGFVNGIPLLFIELKNVHRNIRRAYDGNLADYKDTIPELLGHNGFIVLSNGTEAKVGSVSSKFEHFHEWKRLREEELGVVDLETLLKGMCSKTNFMDIFENFIAFDESSGAMMKIVGRNHQFLGVNRAVEAVQMRHEKKGQLGVFWHTQGAGKSYSMLFFCAKIHRKLEGNFTFLIVTDREDLDNQIYKTFAGCGLVDNDRDRCRASSGQDLKKLLTSDKAYVFTMIHKFNKDIDPDNAYSFRDDIIVVSDEAHRTQYGRLALNMRNALPNAHYIGFTGTPLFKDDEITKKIFGDYVSTYDFQRAVDDRATVPLFYDNRGEKLMLATADINEKIAEKLDSLDLSIDEQVQLEKELSREYHIITAEKRLNTLARDFVKHYTTRWETGKAMLVCIDKITTVRMYDRIMEHWKTRIEELETKLIQCADEQEEIHLRRHLTWLEETVIAVIVSEEQGEKQRFKKWGLDITPHRKRLKSGFDTPDGRRIDSEIAFKDPAHPFRVAIVCAMWLTGFDVPSLSTLYLDKPLKAHTLMQAIARANRVYEGKNNGLIVDYCGILKNLRKALAAFASGDSETNGTCPVKPENMLIKELEEAIAVTAEFLKKQGAPLEDIIETEGFERLNAIDRAKEGINENDEIRKRFEILAREVFKKFKACLTIEKINDYKKAYSTIDIIYKRLQEDREKADITEIIKKLQGLVDEAVEPFVNEETPAYGRTYDISKINFDRLKEEFTKSPNQRTVVQNLKEAVEKRLTAMIKQNPLRMDFNRRYQDIIAQYNHEKDRLTIEQTFEALMDFIKDLDEEDKRAMREGLEQENLALFDILISGRSLTPKERSHIKTIAQELLKTLKSEKLKMNNWQEKESTRSEVKTFIYDYLWDETKGLPPESYTEEDVETMSDMVYEHVYNQYSGASIYACN
jgi:type I restriction enzyme R subunit